MDELMKQLFDAVEQALEGYADVNITDELRDNILRAATEVGRKKMVEFFTANNTSVNTKGKDGNTPLHVAILTHGSRLLEHSGETDEIRHFIILLTGWIIIQLLIEKGADVNAINKYGKTCLHTAVESYDPKPKVVELLIENDADVDAINNNGETCLHIAATTSNIKVVRFLVKEKNADVNARDHDGNTPLYVAAGRPDKEVAEFLIEEGADVSAKNNCGETPLHKAVKRSRIEVVKFLVKEKNADVNARDKYGNTPLHCVDDVEVMRFLIAKDAKVNARNKSRYTPLYYAINHVKGESRKKIVQLLVENGADTVDPIDKFVMVIGAMPLVPLVACSIYIATLIPYIDDIAAIVSESTMIIGTLVFAAIYCCVIKSALEEEIAKEEIINGSKIGTFTALRNVLTPECLRPKSADIPTKG
ncbi:ankyrin repeat domain-containing protein [Wolbachia endosymbiont of Ctenocephalides felis wCfeT]|uniref:ankyrin repeat domain-containing protein n=1 Tax=Wolbachia endosymbiont of Ctenocephalides felis wCfeT TaxID=2732593 RepID=UPI001444D1CA|nr:ankyrin repeat domain-containing protein [Wolbachia endosymbiont of Ctenocephalides felis wCfeT]